MHRDHHKFSDTEKDPHSPVAFKNIFSFMLKTAKEYRYFTDLALERKDDKSLPRWTAFENIADTYPCRIAFIVLYVLIYVKFTLILVLCTHSSTYSHGSCTRIYSKLVWSQTWLQKF